MMEAMHHYQAISNRDKAVAIAKDAAPYMHPRLHAVAGADLKPKGGLLADGGHGLAMIARKVASAFRLLAQKKAEQIEDPADGGD